MKKGKGKEGRIRKRRETCGGGGEGGKGRRDITIIYFEPKRRMKGKVNDL